jgi:hypothetical protein
MQHARADDVLEAFAELDGAFDGKLTNFEIG